MEPVRRTLIVAVLLGLIWGVVEALLTGWAGDTLSVILLPVVVAGGLGLAAAALLAGWAGAAPAIALVTAAVVALPLAVGINLRFLSGVRLASPTNVALLAGCFVVGLLPGWLAARSTRRLPAGLLPTLLALALLSLGGWRLALVLTPPVPGPWPDNRAELGARPNLVLITIDTLRHDHVGWAGYERATTPNLDALKAWRFAQAYSHAPWTTPSTASLLTGLPPSTHQTNDYADVLPEEAETLSQILADAGYVTGYFTANFAVSAPTGLTRGADWVISEMDLPVRRLVGSTLGRVLVSLAGDLDRADHLNEHVFRFLDSVQERRFFAYIHYKDPHQPYDPPPPYDTMFDPDFEGRRILDPAIRSQWPISERERHNMVARYDGEIRFVDDQIGRLLEHLSLRHIGTNTIIVVTSDHGEEFQDHGGWLHGETLYEEMIHVPLLLRYAPLTRQTADIVHLPLRQLDVAPSLLELMDVEAPSRMQGESVGIRRDGSFEKYLTAERIVIAESQRTGLVSTALGDMKLIRKTEGDEVSYALFHLGKDPAETRDLAERRKGEVEMLRGVIETFERQQVIKRMGVRRRTLDEDQEQALRELGYIR